MAEASLAGKRVVISGASGFIGSHLARACVRDGAAVTCLLRPGSNPWRLLEALPNVTCREVEWNDATAVGDAVRDVMPDVIFHVAADTVRKRDLGLYASQHAAHTVTTLHLLMAALALPAPPRFVHTGTIEEYGRGPVPYREDQRERPVTPYSLTKHESVRLALYAAQEHGLPVVVVRPSLTYGPLKGKGMFVPDFMRAALTTRVFDMSAGEQTRDLIYVDDLVGGYFAAATARGVEGEIFNLGTGVETRLKDVAERLRTLVGGEMTVNYGAYPTDPRVETMRSVMDVQKARERLSWQPTITLEDGLARTVEWYRSSSTMYEKLLWA